MSRKASVGAVASTEPKQVIRSGLPLGPLVKDVLKLAYRARTPVLLEGPTGIGKSEVVGQVAAELEVEYVPLDLSLLEPPDLTGLPIIEGGRTRFASPLMLPQDGKGILMVEELNRAERYIQQPVLQLLTARRLNQYELPPGWMICAAINPEHDAYQVTPLDPALRSRFLNLVVRADRKAWLQWAAENDVHPAVLELAREHDRFLDDVPPRTWAFVSQLLHALQPAERANSPLLYASLSGYLPVAWTEVLMSKLEAWEASTGVDVVRLLQSYHTDISLQRTIAELKSQGRTDALETIAYRVLEVVSTPRLSQLIGQRAFCLEAFERFLPDLPGDFRESIQEEFARQLVVQPLLNVRVEDVLSRTYPDSLLARQIRRWSAGPAWQHRVTLVANALCRYLKQDANIPELRKQRGVMISLGRLLEDLGTSRAAQPLWEIVEKLQLPVVVKKA
jgi:MoxR-like ATPases